MSEATGEVVGAFVGEFVCPFCSAPYTPEMLLAFETTCYADTCDMVEVDIRCGSCERSVFVLDNYSADLERAREWVDRDDVENALKNPTETTDFVEFRRELHG
jgi:hypothetical protein